MDEIEKKNCTRSNTVGTMYVTGNGRSWCEGVTRREASWVAAMLTPLGE